MLPVDACTAAVNVGDTPAAGAAITAARLGRPTADTGEDLASEGASEGASETPVAALLACSESWSPFDDRRAGDRARLRGRATSAPPLGASGAEIPATPDWPGEWR